MSHPHQSTDRHGHQHRHDHGHDAGHGQAVVLDWDAQVLADINADIIDQLPVPSPPRSIFDFGCGTGTGTFALLEKFPDASIIAVDSSAEHLGRLRNKAADRGVQDQIRIVQADLDAAGWPDLGTPELVWASASLHHLARPGDALRRLHDLLAPGGLLAVVEVADFPRFLPDDAPTGRPGLEDRCHAATERQFADHLPHRGADWGPTLVAAGFTVEHQRMIPVRIDGADHAGVGPYALAGLRGVRRSVGDKVSPEDLDALDRLLDVDGPFSILSRPDLVVRTERQVWAARAEGKDLHP